MTLKMVALRAGAMLLNVALNAIVSTVANFVITKFNEWRTAIETNAQKSKDLSSSMTDLISQYKELGDKSGWDTDDFAQAKDLNAEILDLLKNQSAEMDKKLRKLDLENGKYALAKAQANKTTRVYGENGYEWEADASAVRDAQSDLSSKRREYKKQEEIDRLNKLKDKVQEATNLIGTSWDDYQKKLKYTSQFEAMTFAEMEGHYDGFMASVVSNMKAVQRATNVSNVVTKLETLIDTLTKLGDVLGNLNGSTQSGGITGL